ncbi:MAG: GTPase HflX, partial [Crocinitomicaceae bacterium]|nr:GTPase HflX [Crocinitomicaceae bacterium]
MAEGHVLVDAVEEKCMLVGVIPQGVTERSAEEYLDELEFLALTAGATTVKRFLQKVTAPNSKTFVGSGKLSEIRDYINANDVDLVIFDDELS